MPVALDQTYDYLVPDGVEVAPGSFVIVPFGPQSRIGIVWDTPRGDGKPVDPKKLKSLTSLIDAPPLPEISMRFAEWVARYSLAPLGMVARMMMSADAAFEPPKHRFGVRIVEGAPLSRKDDAGPHARLGHSADGLIRARADLAHLAGCSTGVIDGLAAAGSLVEVAIPERVFPRPEPRHATTEFTARSGARRRCARQRRRWQEFLGHFARWRHRLGQDGSLFRGRCAHARGRRAGPHHASRDCADEPVSGTLRAPLRLSPRRVAFGLEPGGTRPHLERRCARRRALRRRRAFSALLAVLSAWLDRRR